ncbi:hypothetical protein HKCCE3408_15770 [Rhodobacterales bacterium HKCCE3408]|nr:hypothetical protein [Rhodobacterales bacterium HKCCE3408]
MTPGGSPRLYIAYGDPRANFVEGLSGDAFDQIDRMIQDEQPGSELRELLEYLYYGACEEVPVDDNGRLVLPQAAREKLDLDDEAVFLGKGNRFEIFKPAESEATVDKVQSMLEKLGQGNEHFNPLSLAGKARQSGADGA